MDHKEFICQLDEKRIEAAIAAVEQKTSGEIRVYISHKDRHDPLAFAQKRFHELGLTKTKRRNGVFIYIVPRTRQFAIMGDVGIHEKCGHELWQQTIARMSERMREGKFTDAIVAAIHHAGEALQKHFPRQPDDINELPNKIIGDDPKT